MNIFIAIVFLVSTISAFAASNNTVLSVSKTKERAVSTKSQSVETISTLSLENTLREVAKEIIEKSNVDSDEQLKIDRENLNYNRILSNETKEIKVYTALLVLFALISSVIIFWQVVMFRRQLSMMGDDSKNTLLSVQLARDEFEASNRPWIKCNVTISKHGNPGPVVFTDMNLIVVVDIKIENKGTAPAVNVIPDIEWVIRGDGMGFLVAAQQVVCQRMMNWERGPLNMGVTIFPGETRFFTQSHQIPMEKINVAIKNDVMQYFNSSIGIPLTVQLNAVGCVDYKSAITKKRHQTGFSYSLGAKRAKLNNGEEVGYRGFMLPIVNYPIPIEDLFLDEDHFEGSLFFAN